MSLFRCLELETVEIGEIGATGGMGTTLTTVDTIVPDTASVIFEPTETTNFIPEDSTLPDMISLLEGAKTMEYATWDVGPANLLTSFGGTLSGASIWKTTSGAVATIHKSMKMTSKAQNGFKCVIEYADAVIAGNATLQFAKTAPGQVGAIGTATLPTNGTTPAVKVSFIAA